MKFYREIVENTGSKFKIPPQFVGKRIEITILPLDGNEAIKPIKILDGELQPTPPDKDEIGNEEKMI